jgi:hypothetical protein
MREIELITPGSFQNENHWYPKALNATIHPMVNFFLNLTTERIINRYCHLHPKVDKDKLEELLSYQCSYFLWSGADLINSTSAEGKRQMVVIENNSCPSGQKSMPLMDDHQEEGTYRLLIERAFIPFLKTKKGEAKIEGKVAVFYDKNYMENSGYAAVIADVLEDDVFFGSIFQSRDERSRPNREQSLPNQVGKRMDYPSWHL